MSFVAPSPSRTTIRASSPHTVSIAAATGANAASPGPIGSPPASPVAISRHMSFVDVSPSTVMRLNVRADRRRAARRRHASAVSGASVVTKASIVAMFGWIMPEPLAMPPTV